MWRRFGTLWLFLLHGLCVHMTYEERVDAAFRNVGTLNSEERNSKERIQHSQHGEIFNSRIVRRLCITRYLNQIHVFYIVSGFYWRLLYRLALISARLQLSFVKNVRYKNEPPIYPVCLRKTTWNISTCLRQFWNNTEISSRRLSENCTDGLSFSCNTHFSALHFSNEVTLPSPSSSWDFFL
jgi:hypothetical protein